MNEETTAYRVRQVLNQGLNDIAPAATRRLEAARHLALSKQKQAAPQLVLATPGGVKWSSSFFRNHHGIPFAKQALAIVALLLGMWLAFYWHSVQYISEQEEVDIALLSDDLPPEVFLDDDIYEWLKDDSSPD
jgi:Protein of unknown function (DUF3619)